MSYLNVEKISHWYDPAEILFKNLSFKVSPGSFNLVTGENGKGKSTLLKILVKKLKPREGEVLLTLPLESIAWLPQVESLFFYIPLKLKDLLDQKSSTFLTQKIDLNKNWNEASGGERKRVLLEKIFSHSPKLILLDEPFNHLDASSKQYLMELIEKKRKTEGLAVVVISHEDRALLSNQLTQELSW